MRTPGSHSEPIVGLKVKVAGFFGWIESSIMKIIVVLQTLFLQKYNILAENVQVNRKMYLHY